MLDTDYPFDTDNRAYQRFLTLAGEHFEIVGWNNATGRPAMLTLIDISSRDAFSLALLDTAEDRQPHALLAATTDATLSLHGPLAGSATACDYAPHLAMHNADIAATTPAALHHPDTTTIDTSEWLTIPPDIAAAAHTQTPDTTSVGLVLLDRDRAQIVIVGPFPSPDDAQAWQPDTDGWPPVDRLTVALHPPTPKGD
ncbi:hypothetical protein [Micromonospora endolithica]|uniref:Uncharacterized protein n=1 Tax=Micromonospora endolithica TaxID=230091 RepID=A0A3A9ZCA3_9ACTN|nr:hypothetical protein [Micromonospora endolithica]RKN46162.1 hypothetical protein D7223_14560 [Micromonospora endolithica]TWJ25133.1 hypothetical protein JD76_05296 [Micromonospora endolithica]